MNQNLNENLVGAIKSALPEKMNVALYLMDLLSLGKEAVYRRLRGTVSFNIEESALISKDLNISLDQIVGMKTTDKAIFNLNLIEAANLMDGYCASMRSYIEAVKKIKPYADSKWQSVCSSIPCTFYIQYDLISKFYLYKWVYQMRGFESPLKFAQFSIPQYVLDVHEEFMCENRFLHTGCFILSRNIFISLAKDIALFSRLNALSKVETHQIKEELIELLSNLESIAASGTFGLDGDSDISFYLSNIDFDSSYIHLECRDFELSIFKVFSYSSINSLKSEVCEVHKEWINSLKRSSTLISRSGDVHRTEYFNEQRELLNAIL